MYPQDLFVVGDRRERTADGGLTLKQQAFVNEYLIDGNATAAYRRAGYKAANDNVAAANAHALLKNHKVAAAIAERRKAIQANADLTVERVVKGLLKEAQCEGEGSSHSARVAAWVALGKHLGMFVEKKEITDKSKRRTIIVEVW